MIWDILNGKEMIKLENTNQRATVYNRKKLEHENFQKQNYNMKILNYK